MKRTSVTRSAARRPGLRLLQGGRSETPPRVVVADERSPPFAPDAVVLEQDADLLLAPPSVLTPEPTEEVGRLLVRVLNQRRHPPGSVLSGGGRPLRLHAVVHDMSCEPSWREEWVQGALERLFEVVRRRRIARLAMPLLGTVHGRLDPERALALTLSALPEADAPPHRLWLRVPLAEVETVRALLGAPR